MKQKYIVTNIDKTVQRIRDAQGQYIWLQPEGSCIVTNPPLESYSFHIEELMKESEEMIKQEVKVKKKSLDFEKLKGEKKLNSMEVKK